MIAQTFTADPASLMSSVERILAAALAAAIVSALGIAWAWFRQTRIVKALATGVELGAARVEAVAVELFGQAAVDKLTDEAKEKLLSATKDAIAKQVPEGSPLRAPLDKVVDEVEEETKLMKKPEATGAGAVVGMLLVAIALTLGAAGCRGWPEMQADVKQFRAVLAVYRTNTTAKNVSETAKVDELGGKLDKIADHMEELTR